MAKKAQNVWIISTIVLAVLFIGSGIFAVLATVKNNENKDKISDLEGKISVRDDEYQLLDKKYKVLRKMINAREEADNPLIDEPDTSEDYDEELYKKLENAYSAPTNYVEVTSGYIEIPGTDKKFKVPSNIAKVRYAVTGAGVTIWAVTESAGGVSYDFFDPFQNTAGMLNIKVYSDKYMDNFKDVMDTSYLLSGSKEVARSGSYKIYASTAQSWYSPAETEAGEREGEAVEALKAAINDSSNFVNK